MKTITLLDEKDFDHAYQIEITSHTFPWSKNTFFNNQGKHHFNLKLTHNELLIGFAITQIILDEATLFNIAIDPKYQHQGFGEYLLSELLLQLTQKKVKNVWLEVRRSNLSAISLYHKLGFNEISIRANYYPSLKGKEDAIIMAYYCD